jgi:uncharacterized protein (TIGR04255 family)
MAITEIFPNPVVKTVAFELRFPNLFYLESRIGEFQVEVMKDFPDSELAIQQRFVIAAGPPKSIQEAIAGQKDDPVRKVWVFKSGTGVDLNVASNQLVLSSERHKSYRLGERDRFRDVIETVTGKFLAVVKLPLVSRIGLRYIDECPIDELSNNRFRECYNSAFPLERFPIDTALSMDFSAATNRDGCNLRYIESLKPDGPNSRLVLDFDAWTENIESAKVVEVTDRLHQAISDEFERTVKQPIFEYMRRPKESGNGNSH